jgi:hypothetical protein
MATNKKRLIVEENPVLERDSHSKAILNTDSSAYNYAIRKKAMHLQVESRIESMESSIDSIKEQLDLILKALNK